MMYKQAIRFPNIEIVNQTQQNQHNFSEAALHKAFHTSLETYKTLDGLLGYIVQKNQTNELRKQISAKEKALDKIVEEKQKQVNVALAEEAKRLQIWEKAERERLNLQLEQLHLEANKVLSEFEGLYEEKMKSNMTLRVIVTKELENIQKIQEFIDPLAEEYSRRREYIQLCDVLRRSFHILNQYMQQLV